MQNCVQKLCAKLDNVKNIKKVIFLENIYRRITSFLTKFVLKTQDNSESGVTHKKVLLSRFL